jgi:hypothetical protein
MSNILDHIAPTPVLDVVDNWPRSTTRTEWFRLTRDLIQNVIADIDLDPDSLAQVEEAFISTDLLRKPPLPMAPNPSHWPSDELN